MPTTDTETSLLKAGKARRAKEQRKKSRKQATEQLVGWLGFASPTGNEAFVDHGDGTVTELQVTSVPNYYYHDPSPHGRRDPGFIDPTPPFIVPAASDALVPTPCYSNIRRSHPYVHMQTSTHTSAPSLVRWGGPTDYHPNPKSPPNVPVARTHPTGNLVGELRLLESSPPSYSPAHHIVSQAGMSYRPLESSVVHHPVTNTPIDDLIAHRAPMDMTYGIRHNTITAPDLSSSYGCLSPYQTKHVSNSTGGPVVHVKVPTKHH